MTDAHCHVSCGDGAVRELVIGRDFVGVHPWDADAACRPRLQGDVDAACRPRLQGDVDAACRPRLQGDVDAACRPRLDDIFHSLDADPRLGVGEIGLDRLRTREISETQREVFEAQLRRGLADGRPIVLHGAKCWGQVVKTIQRMLSTSTSDLNPPPLLFHGLSRSDGLIPDIVALGGYISVGPAVLNDHAVNYRELVKKIPLGRLLVETDRTAENAATCPPIAEVVRKVAELRGMTFDELETLTDANAGKFVDSSIRRMTKQSNN